MRRDSLIHEDERQLRAIKLAAGVSRSRVDEAAEDITEEAIAENQVLILNSRGLLLSSLSLYI